MFEIDFKMTPKSSEAPEPFQASNLYRESRLFAGSQGGQGLGLGESALICGDGKSWGLGKYRMEQREYMPKVSLQREDYCWFFIYRLGSGF